MQKNAGVRPKPKFDGRTVRPVPTVRPPKFWSNYSKNVEVFSYDVSSSLLLLKVNIEEGSRSCQVHLGQYFSYFFIQK